VPSSEPEPDAANRDVIVIGASAGGVEAVRRLLAGLPADLPAALFVVIHRGSGDALQVYVRTPPGFKCS
jgi:chemotaxis response regulator CheB